MSRYMFEGMCLLMIGGLSLLLYTGGILVVEIERDSCGLVFQKTVKLLVHVLAFLVFVSGGVYFNIIHGLSLQLILVGQNLNRNCLVACF